MAGGQIYIPPETYVLKSIVRTYRGTVGGRWATRVRRVRAALEGSHDFSMFPLNDLAEAEAEALALHEGDRSLATMLDIFYTHMMRAAGSPAERWGDKTPLNAFALPELHATFPQAQFIHMIRDGYDVVDSYIRMGRYDTFEEAAKRWLEATEACLAFEKAHPAVIQTVLYEDLASHPETTLSKLFPWLGLTYNPDALAATPEPEQMGDIAVYEHLANVSRPVTSASVGKGRKHMSPADLDRVSRLIGGRMASLGYRP